MKYLFSKALIVLVSIWFSNVEAQNGGLSAMLSSKTGGSSTVGPSAVTSSQAEAQSGGSSSVGSTVTSSQGGVPNGGSSTVTSSKGGFSAVIAFGDSILDTGNNNLLMSMSKCNFFPYGRDFPTHKATGRFGNGRVVSDLVVSGLGIKDLLPAFRNPLLSSSELPTGVCFASGGSGLDKVTASIQGVIWVTDQVKDFQKYIQKLNNAVGDPQKAQATITNALFLISAGNNDLAITYYGTPTRMAQYSITKYTDMLIELKTTFLKSLYDLGARKFAVLGTLPLGCLPGSKSLAAGLICLPNVERGAKMFNEKLSNLVTQLNGNLPGAKLVYVDIYTYLKELIDNPGNYGFKTGSKACCCTSTALVPCTDASRYVFWDYGHPSQKAYETILPHILNDISKIS